MAVDSNKTVPSMKQIQDYVVPKGYTVVQVYSPEKDSGLNQVTMKVVLATPKGQRLNTYVTKKRGGKKFILPLLSDKR